MGRYTHLTALIGSSNRLQYPLTRFRIIDERVALGPMDQLEMLRSWLSEDRFGRHFG